MHIQASVGYVFLIKNCSKKQNALIKCINRGERIFHQILSAVISDIFQEHNSHGITVYYKNKNNFDRIFYRTLEP